MANDISAKVINGRLVIELPFDAAGKPSATGKTRVHSSTHGNVAVTVPGLSQPLIVGVNAYTK